MDFTASAQLAAAPAAVVEAVADLATYPRWFTIVRSVVPDGADAWLVDLGAKVGPFTRTKRVRMARVGESRFERRETDGRSHSAWVLEATVTEAGAAGAAGGTHLRMDLHYGGVPWVPGLDLILRNEAKSAARKLQALVTGD